LSSGSDVHQTVGVAAFSLTREIESYTDAVNAFLNRLILITPNGSSDIAPVYTSAGITPIRSESEINPLVVWMQWTRIVV
jgi:hypothetical protein